MNGSEPGQPKDLKDLKTNEPGKADEPTSGDLQPIRNQLSEAAARMRKGQLDNETTKLMREAVDSLNATGRRLTEDDRNKLARNIAKEQAKPDTGDVRKPPAEERVKEAPEGRARETLSSKSGEMKAVQSKPGEMQEDNLRRLIEQGQAKVVPEYRKPVEDYYKAVSK
ncbi:MAG: hypothetical protein HY291_14050 [Planctomycetes bacterium]|nr:hypothetical protein [Planctomycetota bacterium]